MTTYVPAWIDGLLQPVEKLEVHRRGLRHKAVSVFVCRNEELLLQRRALGKYHTPGLWANACCTHPEWDESGIHCATRRLREELGIEGLTCDFRDQIEYRADVGNGMIEHEVVDVFLAEADDDLTIAPNPDEVMDTRWISAAELVTEMSQNPEAFTPWIGIYLSEHRERILGKRL